MGTSFSWPWGQLVHEKKFEMLKVSEELLEKLKPSVRLNVVRWFVTLEVSEVVVLRRVAGKGQEVVSSKNLKTKIKAPFATSIDLQFISTDSYI